MHKFIIFLLSFARSFYDAWVVLWMWTWFIVPLGAPRIGYWHAYGLDVIIGLLAIPASAMAYGVAGETDSYEVSVRTFSMALVGYTMALVIGFGVHLFMTGRV